MPKSPGPGRRQPGSPGEARRSGPCSSHALGRRNQRPHFPSCQPEGPSRRRQEASHVLVATEADRTQRLSSLRLKPRSNRSGGLPWSSVAKPVLSLRANDPAASVLTPQRLVFNPDKRWLLAYGGSNH